MRFGRAPRCAYCYQRYDPHGRHARRHRDGTCTPEPTSFGLGRELSGCVVIALAVIALLVLIAHTH